MVIQNRSILCDSKLEFGLTRASGGKQRWTVLVLVKNAIFSHYYRELQRLSQQKVSR